MGQESPLKGKVILAVDDEPDVLEMLGDILDMCKVEGKTTHAEAVAYLDAHALDLAILDIMGVNGLDLLKQCVQKGIPAVMLTAHALSLETLKQSIDLGAKGYFPKEKIAEFVPFLEDALSGKEEETWHRLFERLGGFFNATFGSDWKKNLIDTGPFIVSR